MATRPSLPAAGLTISAAISAAAMSGHSSPRDRKVGRRRRPARERSRQTFRRPRVRRARRAPPASSRASASSATMVVRAISAIGIACAAAAGDQRRERLAQAAQAPRARRRDRSCRCAPNQNGLRPPSPQRRMAAVEQLGERRRRRAGRCRRAAPPARSFRQRAEPWRARRRAAGTDASAGRRSAPDRPAGTRLRAAAPAIRPGGVRVSGVPPESSARMPKRSSSALTRRARSRSVVTSAAVAVRLDDRAAQRDGDRQRLVALVRRLDQRDAGEGRFERRLAQSARGSTLQSSVVSAGRSASARIGRARGQRAVERADLDDVAASDADLAEQLGEAELRMAEHRGLRRRRVERPTTTARRAQDRGRAARPRRCGRREITDKQLGGGGNRAGRTGRDHRTERRRARQPRRLARGSARCDARPGWSGRARASASGQCDVTISRKSSVTCHQPARLPDDQLAEPRSSRRLRSRSRRSARRGRAPARWHRPPMPARSPPPRTAPRHAPAGGSSRRAPAAPARSSRSSGAIGGASSISPASACEGRVVLVELAERPDRRQDRRARRQGCSANTLRSSRAARRVGTKMVVSASVSGSPSQANSGTSAPVSTASASVGRNGASGRDREDARNALARSRSLPRGRGDGLFGERDGVGRADRDPVAVHLHAEQPAVGDRAVEIAVERLRRGRRAGKDARMRRSPRRHRSARPARLLERASRPSGVDAGSRCRRCGRSLMRDRRA